MFVESTVDIITSPIGYVINYHTCDMRFLYKYHSAPIFLFMDVILLYCLRFSMYVCLASVHALSFSPLDAMRFHDAYHSTMQ